MDRKAGVVRTICLPVKFEDNRTMMAAAEGRMFFPGEI